MPTTKKRRAKRKNPAAVALGKLGGKATLKRHGKAAFSKAGKKGGQKLLKQFGPDYFKRIRKGERPISES